MELFTVEHAAAAPVVRSTRVIADRSAPGNAQLFVERTLEDWLMGRMSDAAKDLVAELSAWLLAHSPGCVQTVTVTRDDDLLMVEVGDEGMVLPDEPEAAAARPGRALVVTRAAHERRRGAARRRERRVRAGQAWQVREVPDAGGDLDLVARTAFEWGSEAPAEGRQLWASLRTDDPVRAAMPGAAR